MKVRKSGFVAAANAGMVTGIALCVMSSVRADVTIVSEVKVTGLPAPKPAPAPAGQPANAASNGSAPAGTTPPAAAAPDSIEIDRTYTTYYKGDKARRESADGKSVVIYDKGADKVYTLDLKAKTYSLQSFKAALENDAALPDSMSSRADLDVSVDIDDQNGDPDSKRTVAEKEADKLSFFGSVNIARKQESRGSGGGGGFPGGGGRGGRRGGGGGGGNSGGGRSAPTQRYAHLTMSGSVWATDVSDVLPEGKKDEKELSIAVLQQELPDASPDLKPFAEEMAKKKKIPLISHISLRAYDANDQPINYDPTAASTNSGPNTTGPLVVDMAVKSIDTKAALDDNLFKLPLGFDRVDPPAPITPLPLPSNPGGPP